MTNREGTKGAKREKNEYDFYRSLCSFVFFAPSRFNTLSEMHLAQALEMENGARFVRRYGFEAEFADDAGHLRHLLGIARRQLTLADIDAVLQPDTDIAAHRERGDTNWELEAPRRRD